MPTVNVMGSKRNRFLIRQPRVKRDSDTANQVSPDATGIDFDPFSGTSAAGTTSTHLLSVPPRIERHASEPAPSLASSSSHLLSVPQNPPLLVKQHSHPLLPSQQHSPMALTLSTATPSFGLGLHRQHSHPLSATTPGHISIPDAIYPHVSTTVSDYVLSSNAATRASSNTSNTLNLTHLAAQQQQQQQQQHHHQHQHSSSLIKQETENSSHPSRSLHMTPSSSVILISEAPSLPPTTGPSATATTHTPTLGGLSFEHVPTLRVKNEELQRSVSSPQTNREIMTLENPRSSHCPVIRPGPALGCNFCWNTIDSHGRILRRKTKYHCPECQTNLCIVPCFQEYHERLSSENTSSTGDNNKSNSATLRHYSKTESI